MADEINKVVKRVCVTGAGGYIGSWLVKNLLQSGYTVNATLRDPGDATKSGPLLRLAGAQDRLHLFKADLCEEGSFDSAVEACEGVFHVASPMGFTNNSLEDFVVPAVKGVLNVLKACSKAKSVSRVVFTSSVGAASPLNGNGEVIHSCLDESCWTPLDIFKSQPSQITMYMTAKTLAEQEALKYGTENDLEVVSIGPATVAGPWLTHSPPLSSAPTILALLGENDKILETLNAGQGILGSLPFVHIDDVCNAHIFLMEQPNVEGRHICSVHSLTIKSLRNLLSAKPQQNLDDTQQNLNQPSHTQLKNSELFTFIFTTHQNQNLLNPSEYSDPHKLFQIIISELLQIKTNQLQLPKISVALICLDLCCKSNSVQLLYLPQILY